MGDQVLSFSKYQVLVNVDTSARLEWTPWHQFTHLPKGAVYTDQDVVVARAWVPVRRAGEGQGGRLVLTPGGLYLQRQYGLLMVAAEAGTHEQQRHTKGQVLVEREAVGYEMTDFFRGRQTAEAQIDVNVPDQHIIIRKDEGGKGGRNRTATGQMFNVSFSRRFYFGKGHNIPTGGHVQVRFRDRPPLDLLWGTEKKEPVVRQVIKFCRSNFVFNINS